MKIHQDYTVKICQIKLCDFELKATFKSFQILVIGVYSVYIRKERWPCHYLNKTDISDEDKLNSLFKLKASNFWLHWSKFQEMSSD